MMIDDIMDRLKAVFPTLVPPARLSLALSTLRPFSPTSTWTPGVLVHLDSPVVV